MASQHPQEKFPDHNLARAWVCNHFSIPLPSSSSSANEPEGPLALCHLCERDECLETIKDHLVDVFKNRLDEKKLLTLAKGAVQQWTQGESEYSVLQRLAYIETVVDRLEKTKEVRDNDHDRELELAGMERMRQWEDKWAYNGGWEFWSQFSVEDLSWEPQPVTQDETNETEVTLESPVPSD